MRCLVTGATGGLGMNLTKRLIQDGHEVIALGRNQLLGEYLTQLGARFIGLDLSEETALQALAKNTELIFHCAALSSPWGEYKDFYQANVLGTQNVIKATPKNARLIHVSSPSIYFDFSEKHNIKEDSCLPKKPVNYYVKTKLMAEHLIDRAFVEQELQVITLRPRAIFGPYDRALLPRLLKAERKGVLTLVGTGQNLIDVTYVENVVESLVLASQAKTQCLGKKYNITNDEPQSLHAIISLLFASLERKVQLKYIPFNLAKKIGQSLELIYSLPFVKAEPRLTAYSAGVLALGQTLNIEAAKHELGYKPVITIAKGMQSFAQWYLDHD
ncbi:NAD(P)-dependent oxidoreductase [Legionella sp. km772]|uniref:NAD-dependent epimerase/dehydratase family protein n=1 Tax=Legionella sp. km772 TaxID=2498111 RepID=UPI000F8F4C5F|nr:NAD(P)-dependent oxidoreductase [Legionella sp. km772]RUR11153.1 NAD(P)-dependent oxidoreductase [Legionella sp. km772]